MTSFEELPLRGEIARALHEMGYQQPTPIQAETLPILLTQDIDFVGQAQTGTGKTAAFGLPILQKLDLTNRQPQALVLCPTRELCMQAYESFEKFGQFMPELKMACVYGGAGMSTQTTALRRGVHVIIATPGRLLDHLNRRNMSLASIRYFVLDEADRMLDMGFLPDVETCLEQMPAERSLWLFSATMPKEIRNISRRFMHNPAEVQVGKSNGSADLIEHRYSLVSRQNQLLALKRLLSSWPDFYGIVFTRTKNAAQDAADFLLKEGFAVGSLHGDMSQEARSRTMGSFRDRALRVLCATDVAARGLDVNDLTHVIHFGLPQDSESFVHRSGRTARAGKSGISLVLLSPEEQHALRRFEKQLNLNIEFFPIPRKEELAAVRTSGWLTQLANVVPGQEVEDFMPQAETLLAGLSREDLMRKMIWQQIAPTLNAASNREPDDLNLRGRNDRRDNTRDTRDTREGGRGERQERPTGISLARWRINIGKRDGFRKLELLEWLGQYSGVAVRDIRDASFQENYTFFSVPEAAAPLLVEAFDGKMMDGRPLSLEQADDSNMQTAGGGGGSRRRENAYA
jgi:ATP-dependent RNA helicase DeaD